MEFSFKIDPERDLAIGTELSFEEVDESYEDELVFDFTDVDPMNPTHAKPGSIDKVKMLAARYAAGVPLWHDSDCYDHGPVGVEVGAGGDSFLEEEEEEEDL
ncbi:MAG: hypothetical protein KDA75_06310 [Planctomycetaceae bacterium]|nr:hypothetical protein [Planctomycetaceae bacterium]